MGILLEARCPCSKARRVVRAGLMEVTRVSTASGRPVFASICRLVGRSVLGRYRGRLSKGGTIKVSEMAGSRCKGGLSEGIGRLMRELGGGSFGPLPSLEMCVPGKGKGGQPLKVTSCRSGVMRVTIGGVLKTVCRPEFLGYVCKFEPGEKYRRTVGRMCRQVDCKGVDCVMSTSVGNFFSRVSRS